MNLIGKCDFKNFGIFEVWESSRPGKSSPMTIWVKHTNGRWISPFERRVRGWPSLPTSPVMQYLMKRVYKGQPVMQLIAAENPMFDLIKDFKGGNISIRASLPRVFKVPSRPSR